MGHAWAGFAPRKVPELPQVTATANGVTSPPVTVYVHQHIDTITLSLINPPIPQPDCITLATGPGIQNYLDFQAHAFSERVAPGGNYEYGRNLHLLAEPIPTVATVNTSDPALNNNNGKQITQARFTAAVPGRTQIFASVASAACRPIPDVPASYFETCLVQSMNLQVGNAATNTTFAIGNNTSGVTLTPTVIDRLGNDLQNPVPALTFITSSAANASVSSAGAVSTKAVGGVSITAECFAPTCNVGLQPLQPVYSSTIAPNGDTCWRPNRRADHW